MKLLLPILLLLACVSFWLSPAPAGGSDEYWGTYARLSPRLGFVINGDSREYLTDAREPDRLLLAQEVRQSRPLYIMAGAAVGRVLRPVLGSAYAAAGWGGIAAETPDFLPYYAAYVLLNFAVLLASLFLFRRVYQLLTPGRGDLVVLLELSVFLVSNPVTKAFFWTAHQQMFTFFTPLLILYGLLRYRGRALTTRQSSFGALALGVLPLVYGNFVLLLPALFYHLLSSRAGRRGWVIGLQLLLAAICFVLPTLAWIGLLKSQGVTYYNHEAERFHQFTWLLEAWQESAGAFFTALGTNLLTFGLNLRTIGLFLVAVLGLGAVPDRRAALPPGSWPVLGFVFGLFLAFYALLGYYPERLTFTLVPVLLAMLAGLLPPGRLSRLAVLLTAVGWHLYQVISYGPFS
ncbi:hypothetical protein [Hymenobacter persicinus]|uniref:Glycosyltransferase RgtA/B/C/D-like domain-containing protein n=1 Tax=Hymenobacter persicinus TaxID=2025506 RepID=A0A4V1ZAM3_9BACT|nr:hypothetical protein [Hymenobacter persicinus]RYU78766.1 hypothetical protein EWM57_12615 [Hymenobacter persicinus]